ncbi:MAG TPA: AMP-binding protein [Acidimicrobiales bacterium]
MEPTSPRPNSHSLEALIAHQAESRGSASYLLEARGARALSFSQLFDDVVEKRNQFVALGIGRGTRVGLLLSDPLTFSTWFLAGLANGVWVAPLDPTVTLQNLHHVDERALALSLATVLSDRDAPKSALVTWINVVDGLDQADEQSIARFNVMVDDGGVLLSSSGTTGTPKVMALPTAQLLDTAELIARHNELSTSDRGFNPLPLWHVNAEVVGLLATLVAGSSLVLDDRFHRTGFWKIVDDFEITWINAVPAIISHLVTLHDGETPAPRVRFVRSASAPLSPLLFAEFESSTGIPIIQSYGMTEAASQICANPLHGVRKAGSVGVPVGVSVRVVPLDDETSTNGVDIGHIEIMGPTVIRAYESAAYDDRFDVEGWLRTGDLGYFDDDHYLFIVGRSDDVINRGGEKIYPLEIENVLATVEGVAIVAVIGESDEVFGQVPVAYVQPSDAETLISSGALGDLVQRIRLSATEAFSKAYRPAIVKVVGGFPSHATGKIRKGLLREGDVTVVHEERL